MSWLVVWLVPARAYGPVGECDVCEGQRLVDFLAYGFKVSGPKVVRVFFRASVGDEDYPATINAFCPERRPNTAGLRLHAVGSSVSVNPSRSTASR